MVRLMTCATIWCVYRILGEIWTGSHSQSTVIPTYRMTVAVGVLAEASENEEIDQTQHHLKRSILF